MTFFLSNDTNITTYIPDKSFTTVNSDLLALNIIWIVIAVTFALCVIYGTIYHLKYSNKVNDRSSKSLSILGIIYGVFTLLCMVIVIVQAVYWIITDNAGNNILIFFVTIAWFSQSYCFILVLFVRLYFVFRGSVYQLSRCTVVAFSTMLIIEVVICAFLGIFGLIPFKIGEFHVNLLYILFFMAFVFFILLAFTISILFLYKLIIVFRTVAKDISDKNNAFLSLITKNTILLFISISISVLSLTALFLIQPVPEESRSEIAYICHYVFTIDLFSNFICIKLTYKAFDGYYNAICGLLDTKCKSICAKIILTQKLIIKSKTIDPIPMNKVNSRTGYEETV